MLSLKMSSYLDADMPWEDVFNPVTGKTIQRKHFLKDSDTGMEVMVVRYPTGTITPKHTHPCAHGLYVLSGKLYTHEGLFGPGDFVWYPEGNVGEHGATDEGPVTLVFVTNKSFDISFVQ
jgi:quercetin dioxygenase-like cupin family protein